MIPDSVINDIQDRVNIVDIISEHVPLKRAGKNFKGLCPFHQERTPSFSVNSEKQFFHCFGCGESGNVFTFLVKRKKIDFREAAQELAARAGVEIPEDAANRLKNSEFAELHHAVKLAAEFYMKALENVSEAAPVRKYVAGRGLTRDALLKFGIGYSP